MHVPSDIKWGRMQVLAVVGSAALLILVVVGFYFFTFWGTPLSEEPSDWASFGGYFSGVVSPVFSAAAFIAVIYTVRAQAYMLEQNNRHQHLLGLQELLSSISDRTESLLTTTVDSKSKHTLSSTDLLHFITIGGEQNLNGDLVKDDSWEQLEGERYSLLSSLRHEIRSLDRVLADYHGSGGHETVVKYYKSRYEPIMAYLMILDTSLPPLPTKILDIDGVAQLFREDCNGGQFTEES